MAIEEILSGKVTIDTTELDKLLPKAKEILDTAAREGESYTQRVKRQAKERTDALVAENKAAVVAINEQRAENIKSINTEELKSQKALESAKKQELADAKATKSKEALIVVEQKYAELLRLNAQQADQARGVVNRESDAAIVKANESFSKASAEVDKTTTAFGQLKSIADPLFKGLNEGSLSVDDLTATFGNLTKAGGPLGAVLVGLIASLGLLKSEADAAVVYQKNIEGASQASGLAEKTTAGFALQLQRIGESRESAGSTLSQYSQRVEEAKKGSTEALQAFRDLGVSAEDLIRLSPDQILLKMSDAYDALGNTSKRAKATAAIFGDDDAVNFAKIASGIRSAADEAERFGLVFTPEEKKAVEEYSRAVNEVSIQFERLKIALGKFTLKPAAETISFWTQVFGGGPQIEADGEAVGQKFRAGLERGVKGKADIPVPVGPVKAPPAPGVGAGLPPTIDSQLADIEPLLNAAEVAGETTQRYAELYAIKEKINNLDQESLGVLKRLADAMGGTVDQVYQLVNGDIKRAEQQLGQIEKTNEATEATRKQADAQKKLQEAADGAALQLLKLSASNQQLVESTKVANDQLVEGGLRTRVQAAEAIFNVVRSTAEEELKVVGTKIEAERKLYAEGTQERIDAESAFEKSTTEINGRVLEAQKALNSEAASVRSRNYGRLVDELGFQEDRLLQKVRDRQRDENLSETDAATERHRIRQSTIDLEIAATERQLAGEHVGYEERQALESRLLDLRRAGRQEELRGSEELTEAKIADQERYIAKIQALMQLESVRDEARINKAKEYGASEYEISLFQLQSMQRQLVQIGEIISAKEREKAPESELIQLQAQREALIEKIRVAQNKAYSEGAAGAGKQAKSEEQLKQELIDRIQKGKDAIVSATEGIGGAIAGLNRIAAENLNAVAGATLENIDKIVTELRKRFIDAAEDFAFAPSQIAGLFQLQFDGLYTALQAANRKQAELYAQEQARLAKEQQELNDQAREDARSLQESIASDRLAIDKSYAEKKTEIETALSKLPGELAKEELALKGRHVTELTKYDDEYRKRRREADEEAARQAVRTELDLQASLKAARNQGQQDALATANKFLDDEGKLAAQLFEARAKGDKDGAKKIQDQLDLLGQKRRLEEKRQSELDAALASGKSKEEIDAQVESINSRYNAEREYLDQRYNLLVLRNNAVTDEQKRFFDGLLTQLDSNFTQQKALIQQRYTEQLGYLKQKNTLEEQERARVKAKEQQDYIDQRNEILRRQGQELSDLRQRFKDRETELNSSLAKEKAAWEQAYSDLEKRSEEAYNKLSDLAKGYFDKVAAGIKGLPTAPAAPGAPPANGNQASSNSNSPSTGGGNPTAGQQGTTGNQSGPSSTTNNEDPNTAPKGGNATGGPTRQPNGGDLANSGPITDKFIAFANTFARGEGFPSLKNALYNLELSLKGYRSGQVDVPPVITRADYDRALAALRGFWNLRNVWGQFGKGNLKASRVIDLIGQMVEAGFVGASQARPFIDVARKFINGLGQNTAGKVPKFEDVAGSKSVNDGGSDLKAAGASDIREGGLTAPGTFGSDPVAGLKDSGGPTPIPGPGGAGKTNPFAGPIKPPRKQNRFTKGATGTVVPPTQRPDITGSQGRPYNQQDGINFVLGAFAEVKSGQRDTGYAYSKIAEWWRGIADADKDQAHRVVRAAEHKLIAFGHGDKTALDSFTAEDIRLFGDGTNFNFGPDQAITASGGTQTSNSSTPGGGLTSEFAANLGASGPRITASPLLLQAAQPTQSGGVGGTGLLVTVNGKLGLVIDPEGTARKIGGLIADDLVPVLRRLQ